MPRDKAGTVRKVFMLPDDLVERIAAYQHKLGIPSEVEAVRRLLDDGLKYRDDWWSLANRFRRHLAESRSLREAARDTLVDHPMITSMGFSNDSLEYTMSTGEQVQALADGSMQVRSKSGDDQVPPFEFDANGKIANPDLPF